MTYGDCPGSYHHRLDILIDVDHIRLRSSYYTDPVVWYDTHRFLYGICKWNNEDPGIELSKALLRRDMIGVESVKANKMQPDWIGQKKLHQVGIRRVLADWDKAPPAKRQKQ